MGFIYFWFDGIFTIRNYIHQHEQYILPLKRFILRANLFSSVLYSQFNDVTARKLLKGAAFVVILSNTPVPIFNTIFKATFTPCYTSN